MKLSEINWKRLFGWMVTGTHTQVKNRYLICEANFSIAVIAELKNEINSFIAAEGSEGKC